MKKILFFALALVASVLAFTSCDPNNPNNPTNPDEINVKDYVGSTWFLDSVEVEAGRTTSHMCQPIFLLSENTIQIGNDKCPFRYENSILYIKRYGDQEMEYRLISIDKNGAVVNGGGDASGAWTYYISALPVLDRNQQSPISESAMLGTYKMVIGSMEETKLDGTVETSYTIGGMISWNVLKENHIMTFKSTNYPDQDGYWNLKPEEKKIAMGVMESYDQFIQYAHYEDILVFNEDYLVTGSDYDYDPSMGMTHRHYESVFVRIK